VITINHVLPEKYVKRLVSHNIRFLEQFLSLVELQGQADALAATLDIPIEAVQALVEKIHQEYPDLKVPRRSTREYATGYRKPSDY
jgi:hypothetical protein